MLEKLVHQEFKCYITKLTVLVIAIMVSAQEEPDIGYRPVPEDLMSDFVNKTEYERLYEECMMSYAECKGIVPNVKGMNRNTKVCGIIHELRGVGQEFIKKREFKSICDMVYESCKGENEWHFLNDGECSGENTSIPTTTTTTTQPK